MTLAVSRLPAINDFLLSADNIFKQFEPRSGPLIKIIVMNTWADPEGATGGPDPPEKSQKYRVSYQN